MWHFCCLIVDVALIRVLQQQHGKERQINNLTD